MSPLRKGGQLVNVVIILCFENICEPSLLRSIHPYDLFSVVDAFQSFTKLKKAKKVKLK